MKVEAILPEIVPGEHKLSITNYVDRPFVFLC